MQAKKINEIRLLSTRNMVLMGMLAALATVLMFISFPIPFAPPFYKVDVSDLPIMIGAFAMGPLSGIIMEFLKNILHIIVSGTDTYGVGELANFLSGTIFVCTAAMIYKYKKTKMTAVISLIVATILMSIASCFINLYLTLPAYVGFSNGKLSMEAILSMGSDKNSMVTNMFTFLSFAVLPFNLLKCTIVSVLTGCIYKFVSPLLKGSASVRKPSSSEKKTMQS